MLEPDCLEVLLDAMAEQDCDFVTANYRVMDADGRNLRELGVKRNHGAPWGRAYSREIWRGIEFPEGLWFEDSIQAYCISSKWEECYLEHFVYRYRKQASSISANCAKSKKGSDSYWVTEALLGWCRGLDIPMTQRLYDQTLKQAGPLAYYRAGALNDEELRVYFACFCGLIDSVEEFAEMKASKGPRWTDLENALRSKDYGAWKFICESL